MRKIVFIIVFCMLLFFLFFFPFIFTIGMDGYKITNIHMQRIEFDDSMFNDRIIYALNAECEVTEGLVPWGVPSTGATENGCYDSIKGIVIEDSASHIITDSLAPFNLSPKFRVAQKEDSKLVSGLQWVKNWEDILLTLKNGRPYEVESCIFLYADKNVPQPTSVTIKFSDHEIKARVNNTPVKYSIIKRE